MFQMRFYALVWWRMTGDVPRLLQLMYLGNGELLRYEPDEADLLSTERKVLALRDAIARAADCGHLRALALEAVRLVQPPGDLPGLGRHPAAAAATRAVADVEPDGLGPNPGVTCAQSPRLPTGRGALQPASVSTLKAPSFVIGATCGIATTRQPAATAEATPVGESSRARHLARIDAQVGGRRQVGLGMRLAVRDVVAGDDDVEAGGAEIVRDLAADRIDEPVPRRRHERRGDRSALAPRHAARARPDATQSGLSVKQAHDLVQEHRADGRVIVLAVGLVDHVRHDPLQRPAEARRLIGLRSTSRRWPA